MAFFNTLKKNLTSVGHLTMDKAKTTAEILKLKDQIRQDKKEIRIATYKIGKIYRELHPTDYEEVYEDCFQTISSMEKAIAWKEDALQALSSDTSDSEGPSADVQKDVQENPAEEKETEETLTTPVEEKETEETLTAPAEEKETEETLTASAEEKETEETLTTPVE